MFWGCCCLYAHYSKTVGKVSVLIFRDSQGDKVISGCILFCFLMNC